MRGDARALARVGDAGAAGPLAELEAAAAAVDGAERLVLVCHAHPDGDALGSTLALAHLCWARGREAWVSWGEPFRVGPHYRFLPGLDRAVPPGMVPREGVTVVTFDTGHVERLRGLEPVLDRADEVVVLDHHGDNRRFGTVNVVLTEAAATAVVVRRLAAVLGWPPTVEAALCMYVGLVTDTGRFQYPNTTAEVFEFARELAGYGLPIPQLCRELFDKHRFAYLQLAASALSRMHLDRPRRFVAAWVTAEDLDAHGVEFDETEGLIDLVRQTAEADVACVLKEAPGEGLRVSLRSMNPAVDVAALAARLGGGGHWFMSGFVSRWSIPETIDRIARLIDAGVARRIVTAP